MTMMPARTAIDDTYPLPSNSTARSGFGALWDAIKEFFEAVPPQVASAATVDIGAQSATKMTITGTTGINGFGTTYRGPIYMTFAGAVTVTPGSALITPGGTPFTTVAGDIIIAIPHSSNGTSHDGWQVVSIFRAANVNSVAFSATPAFDASNTLPQLFGTLTGNVTAMTIANPQAGQILSIRFKQDHATAGWTVALPTGAKVSGAIGVLFDQVSYLNLIYNAADTRWEGTWTVIPV